MDPLGGREWIRGEGGAKKDRSSLETRALHWAERYLLEVRPSLVKQGACHLIRHSVATVMLEGGADVQVIQEMLGPHR